MKRAGTGSPESIKCLRNSFHRIGKSWCEGVYPLVSITHSAFGPTKSGVYLIGRTVESVRFDSSFFLAVIFQYVPGYLNLSTSMYSCVS